MWKYTLNQLPFIANPLQKDIFKHFLSEEINNCQALLDFQTKIYRDHDIWIPFLHLSLTSNFIFIGFFFVQKDITLLVCTRTGERKFVLWVFPFAAFLCVFFECVIKVFLYNGKIFALFGSLFCRSVIKGLLIGGMEINSLNDLYRQYI